MDGLLKNQTDDVVQPQKWKQNFGRLKLHFLFVVPCPVRWEVECCAY